MGNSNFGFFLLFLSYTLLVLTIPTYLFIANALEYVNFSPSLNYDYHPNITIINKSEPEEKISDPNINDSLIGYLTVISILIAVKALLLTMREVATPLRERSIRKIILMLAVPSFGLTILGLFFSMNSTNLLYHTPSFSIMFIPLSIIIYLTFWEKI